MLWAFIPIAVLVTITPGAGTAMVLRSALRSGAGAALRTIAGNELGVITWALLSIAGISALVAASEVAFIVLKVTGAACWCTSACSRCAVAARRSCGAAATRSATAS